MRPTVDRVLLAVGISGAVLAPLPAMMFAQQYGVLTQQFGVEMAPVTQTALAWYPYAWVLPILVLAAWWFWPKRPRRALVAFLIGVVGALVGWLFAFTAMWWPIYRMAWSVMG